MLKDGEAPADPGEPTRHPGQRMGRAASLPALIPNRSARQLPPVQPASTAGHTAADADMFGLFPEINPTAAAERRVNDEDVWAPDRLTSKVVVCDWQEMPVA